MEDQEDINQTMTRIDPQLEAEDEELEAELENLLSAGQDRTVEDIPRSHDLSASLDNSLDRKFSTLTVDEFGRVIFIYYSDYHLFLNVLAFAQT